ncbi:hypothetical protein OK016_14235 [Vibrio chagasii]|nr:hypothetical protein [Vibrio chagasii]
MTKAGQQICCLRPRRGAAALRLGKAGAKGRFERDHICSADVSRLVYKAQRRRLGANTPRSAALNRHRCS